MRGNDLFSSGPPPAEKQSDLIIVGAGLAGATASAVLGRLGVRVTLVDPRPNCPPVFKAEKIEPDQLRLMRKLCISEVLLSRAAPIRNIHAFFNGRLYGTSHTEQYGTYYSDMVNSLRNCFPQNVQCIQDRVVQISSTASLQRVRLAGGEELTCRLVILASGLNADLPAALGLKRLIIQKHQSIALAFTLASADKRQFAFDSASYYSISPARGVDYITVFPIRGGMRANLFAFPDAADNWVGDFIRNPESGLRQCFPKLASAIGEYRITSKVESSIIHLYRTEGGPLPGIVLIGDAAQNVCPSTGMGLSKIFTDVDALSERVVNWLGTPGMDRDKVASFFLDPVKSAIDTKALRNAFYRRQAATAKSIKWRLHRAKLHLAMQFRRPTEMTPSRE